MVSEGKDFEAGYLRALDDLRDLIIRLERLHIQRVVREC